MKTKLLDYVACPLCGSDLEVVTATSQKDELVQEQLKCVSKSCSRFYTVKDGMPDLLVTKFEEEEAVIESFGFEWGAHLEGKIEQESVFGRTLRDDLDYFFQAVQIAPEQLKGKLILDAGCGSATLTRALASYGPEFVVGTDIHRSLVQAHKKALELVNCQLIRSDIFHIPFRSGVFDIVWCNGVIHHTPNAALAFSQLAAKVRQGGLLYVWVYEKGFYPFRVVKDLFRIIGLDRMPLMTLFSICKVLSVASLCVHSIYRLILFIPVSIASNQTGRLRRTLRYRSYQEFLLTWFDSLSPKFDSRHTKEEVTKWFIDSGFTDLKYYNNQIGIVGRKL